jgi:hypothetical protein
LLLDRKKLIVLVLTLTFDFIFEKRAAKFIRRYKIAYFYVKIGFWILTTNVTEIILYKNMDYFTVFCKKENRYVIIKKRQLVGGAFN